MPPKLFSLTHFRKNSSATPLVSHTLKTNDLKPFRFTHFQKKGRGWVPLSNLQPHTSNLRSSLSPLDSALTSKRAPKSFTCNTYEKHTQGEGSLVAQASACVWRRSVCPGFPVRIPHQPPLPLLPPMPYNLPHSTGAKENDR